MNDTAHQADALKPDRASEHICPPRARLKMLTLGVMVALLNGTDEHLAVINAEIGGCPECGIAVYATYLGSALSQIEWDDDMYGHWNTGRVATALGDW